MKERLILLLSGILITVLSALGQATSLTIDNQTPGWLSSKIPYSDQQTIENLTLSGYVNKDDMAFIVGIIENHNLRGHLDFSDLYLVGTTPEKDNNYEDIRLWDYNVNVNYLSWPKLAKNIHYHRNLDSLVIGGESMRTIKNVNVDNYTYLEIREGSRRGLSNTHARFYEASSFSYKLKTLKLPTTYKTIAHGVFGGLKALENFEFPSQVTSLGEYVFEGTDWVKGKKLSVDSLSKIWINTFNRNLPDELYCSSTLKTVDITGKESSDEFNIPRNSNPITFIFFRESVVDLELATFFQGGKDRPYEYGGLTVYVPENLVEEYKNHEYWKKATILPNPRISYINVSGPEYLYIGDQFDMTCDIYPENSKDYIDFKTSSSIVECDTYGHIRAIAPGTTLISGTAKYNNKTSSKQISVYEHTTGISVVEEEKTMKIGEVFDIQARTLPINTSDNRLSFESSNSAVASVDDFGVVTAKNSGNCTIKVTSLDRGYEKTVRINVYSPVTGVQINPTSLHFVNLNETQHISASVTPSNATNNQIILISTNENVCTVTPSGDVTSKGYGSATIIATTVDGGFTARCAVDVNSVSVTDVILNFTSLSLNVGQKQTLTATILPDTATDKTVIWTSSNVAVASVTNNGEVEAHSVGTAIISASCGNITVNCTITVSPIKATGINLSQLQMLLYIGETGQLTASVIPDNTTDKTVTWISSDNSVATVSGSGEVLAMALGSAIITASCGNVYATCAVTVSPVIATGITLNQTQITLLEGATEQITATITPENTTDKTIVWNTTDSNIASVDNGLVKANNEGVAVVTASCGYANATCIIIVRKSDGIELITIGESQIWTEHSRLLNPDRIEIAVYTIGGLLIYSGQDEQINLESGEVYIVHYPGGSIKILTE